MEELRAVKVKFILSDGTETGWFLTPPTEYEIVENLNDKYLFEYNAVNKENTDEQ